MNNFPPLMVNHDYFAHPKESQSLFFRDLGAEKVFNSDFYLNSFSENKILVCHDFRILNHADKVPNNSLLVVVLRGGSKELSLKPFKSAIKSKQVILILGGEADGQASSLADFIDINAYEGWIPLIPKNLLDVDSEYFRLFYRTLAAKINIKSLYRATQIKTSYNFLINSLINAPLVWDSIGFKCFNNTFRDKPFLIIAAGPSLNKQLPILSTYQDFFITIAVNTVWPLLNKYNIIPDFIFSLDSGAVPSWGNDSLHKGSCFKIDVGCSPNLVWSTSKNHMFSTSSPSILRLLDRLEVSVEFNASGGSVATSAFELARTFGANPIILIGQDLALTNGKDHADGYLHKYSEDILKKREDDGFDIEGYYGDQVRTERQLLFYKNWYEGQIKDYPDTMVINSTEGGAKINGSLQIPFLTVCEELAASGISLKNEMPQRDLKFNLANLLKISKNIDVLIEEVNKFIELSYEGELLIRNGLDQSEKSILKKIDKLNFKITKFDQDVVFIVDCFSQMKMHKISFQAHMDGQKKTLSLAILKYLDIYIGIQESGYLCVAMLEKVRGFYKELLERGSFDIDILEKFNFDENN